MGKSFDFIPDGGIVAAGTLASDTGQLFAVVRLDANLDPVWTTRLPAEGSGFGVVWTP